VGSTALQLPEGRHDSTFAWLSEYPSKHEKLTESNVRPVSALAEPLPGATRNVEQFVAAQYGTLPSQVLSLAHVRFGKPTRAKPALQEYDTTSPTSRNDAVMLPLLNTSSAGQADDVRQSNPE
jgi:hypothetical protein